MHIIINCGQSLQGRTIMIEEQHGLCTRTTCTKMVQFTTCKQEQQIVPSITQNMFSVHQQQLYDFSMPQRSAAKIGSQNSKVT